MEDKDLREKLLSEGTSWLLEMELLDSPQLKNFLILNIYNASTYIKDVELLIDINTRVMMVYLKLTWFGRLFKKQKEVSQLLTQLITERLPSFRVRVVYSQRIFELALKKAQEMLNPKPMKTKK